VVSAAITPTPINEVEMIENNTIVRRITGLQPWGSPRS
jgi:hypothetical protein